MHGHLCHLPSRLALSEPDDPEAGEAARACLAGLDATVGILDSRTRGLIAHAPGLCRALSDSDPGDSDLNARVDPVCAAGHTGGADLPAAPVMEDGPSVHQWDVRPSSVRRGSPGTDPRWPESKIATKQSPLPAAQRGLKLVL